MSHPHTHAHVCAHTPEQCRHTRTRIHAHAHIRAHVHTHAHRHFPVLTLPQVLPPSARSPLSPEQLPPALGYPKRARVCPAWASLLALSPCHRHLEHAARTQVLNFMFPWLLGFTLTVSVVCDGRDGDLPSLSRVRVRGAGHACSRPRLSIGKAAA